MAKRKRASTPPSEPEEDTAIDSIEESPSPPPAKRQTRNRASKPSPEPSPEPEEPTASETSPSPPPAKRAKKTIGKGKAPAKNAAPKTAKIPKSASANKKKVVKDDAPAGFKTWKTSTKLVSGGKLSAEDSQFNVTTSKFWLEVKVENSVAFSLKPLTITEGPLTGRHVLVLEPLTPSNYFRFLDLPPELRGMIYDLLFQEPDGIVIRTHKPVGQARRAVRDTFRVGSQHKQMQWDKLSGKWIGQKPGNFSLLRVNRQIRDEAAAVAYGNHAFTFNDMAATAIFLDAIGSMRKHLRHIEFYVHHQYKHGKAPRIFNLLKEAEGLRSLKFEHSTICGKSGWRWTYSSTAEAFILHCSSMLRALHKARKERPDVIDVRELIKVGKGSSKCNRFDHEANGDCEKTACSVLCKDLGTHDEELATKIRGLVAKAVGIVEKVTVEKETVGIGEETVGTGWVSVRSEEEMVGTGWETAGNQEEPMGTGWDSAGEE